MNRSHMLPSGRHTGIEFIVPDDWTPQQALAVLERLDDLREVICSRYRADIQCAMRKEREPSERSLRRPPAR
ncbi:MAG: hypothetical protein CBARDMAM_1996 [uncultured Caballeronia sp.]|nr:MAG: hypothetical protein CBARDMAM_1996 [uncultured Caballeronia sp.]